MSQHYTAGSEWAAKQIQQHGGLGFTSMVRGANQHALGDGAAWLEFYKGALARLQEPTTLQLTPAADDDAPLDPDEAFDLELERAEMDEYHRDQHAYDAPSPGYYWDEDGRHSY